MPGRWVSYTNEKLYLAQLQFDLLASAELAGNMPLKESARQAGLFFMYAAWLGVLNEIAESFQLKKVEIGSLADLEKALGASTSEVSLLLALHEDPQSWLRLLQRDYDACLRPQPKTEAVQHTEQIFVASGNEQGEHRYQLMLQDLKEHVAAFRDRTSEW